MSLANSKDSLQKQVDSQTLMGQTWARQLHSYNSFRIVNLSTDSLKKITLVTNSILT